MVTGSAAPVVRLNVGGRVFMAAKATLAKAGFLAALLQKQNTKDMVDADGEIYIDRDPQLFAEVLRLLRGYTFSPHPRLTWQDVRDEAAFYQVRASDVDALTPRPVQVVPPERLTTQKVSLFSVDAGDVGGNTWYVREGREGMTDDVDSRMPDGRGGSSNCVDLDLLWELGFQEGVIDDDHLPRKVFTRQLRTVCYAKPRGDPIAVPFLPDEVDRKDCPHWVQVSYKQQQPAFRQEPAVSIRCRTFACR